MAIGYSSGYIRKKVGDKVYYTNQNVKGKVKQVWRAYQSEVNNPKTSRQSNQRSLFVAAKNFRRGFETLLNHSWQGKKYGVQSLNHFSSLVLNNGGKMYPGFFLQPKNSQKFIPQPWPLSTGSIAGLTSAAFDAEGNSISPIKFKVGSGMTTLGLAAQDVLAANPYLKDGDMITICAVLTTTPINEATTASTFIPVFDRIVLDVNSTVDNSGDDEAFPTQNGALKIYNDAVPGIAVGPAYSGMYLAAFGVIVSRLAANGNTYERSTSTMAVRSEIADLFNDTEYVNNCIASFMDDSILTSDWYLNQVGYDPAAGGQGGGGVTASYEAAPATLAGGTILQNALFATIGGVRKPVASSLAVVHKVGGTWQYTPGASLLPTGTDAWTIAEFEAQFPDVTITLVENP
jgi:hypothetical protein